MFDGKKTVFVVWAKFNYVSNCKCSQHCSHLGNDCLIIIDSLSKEKQIENIQVGCWLMQFTSHCNVQYILYCIGQGMYDIIQYCIFVQYIKWIDIVFLWSSHIIPIEFPKSFHNVLIEFPTAFPKNSHQSTHDCSLFWAQL